MKGKVLFLALSVLATIQIYYCAAAPDEKFILKRKLDDKSELESYQDLSLTYEQDQNPASLSLKENNNLDDFESLPYGVASKRNRLRRQVTPDNSNHMPNFTSRFYYKSIPCDLRHESIVITVGAKVPDGSIIRYSFDSGNEDGLFFIGELNGNIRLLATPRIQDYELIVRATVNSNMNLYNTVQVYIHVYFPGGPPRFRQSFYQANITEQQPTNTPVIRIEALSDDKLTYAITSGNQHASFVIGQTSGDINTTRSLIYSPTINTYALTVSATDISQEVSTIKVMIRVVRSPYRPLFQPASNSHHPWRGIYYAKVIENATVGSVVLRVHAMTILSARSHDQITYYIASGNSNQNFLLNPNTGYLTVSKPLDREKQSHYQFSIRATSNKYPMLYDDATVNITITDINDNSPKFNASCLTDEKSKRIAALKRQGSVVKVGQYDRKSITMSDVEFLIDLLK